VTFCSVKAGDRGMTMPGIFRDDGAREHVG
jgi:hypothetical protein